MRDLQEADKGHWSLLRPASRSWSQGQAGHNVKLQTVRTSQLHKITRLEPAGKETLLPLSAQKCVLGQSFGSHEYLLSNSKYLQKLFSLLEYEERGQNIVFGEVKPLIKTHETPEIKPTF